MLWPFLSVMVLGSIPDAQKCFLEFCKRERYLKQYVMQNNSLSLDRREPPLVGPKEGHRAFNACCAIANTYLAHFC
jgi:hypothetical protein